MLKTTIGWKLMFRVSTREKADKAFARANELLDGKLTLEKSERYWKIPELWVCDCSNTFDAASVAEQIAGCLSLANRLAYSWSVNGPNLGPDGSLESLWGVFKRDPAAGKLQSLEWASFDFVKAATSGSGTEAST